MLAVPVFKYHAWETEHMLLPKFVVSIVVRASAALLGNSPELLPIQPVRHLLWAKFLYVVNNVVLFIFVRPVVVLASLS